MENDLDPSDAVSEEFMILLHQQTQTIETLIEQQQQLLDQQQSIYDALTNEESDPPEPGDSVAELPDNLPSFY